MKRFIINFLCVIAFILCFVGNVFATDFGITSVVYDDSMSFLSINSNDNGEYMFNEVPKLYVDQQEHKAYFDINPAELKIPAQDLIINSNNIKEVLVKQHSVEPNVVRVTMSYNDGFNPKNIQLKRLNNSLFVRFSTAQIQNYYFQHVYTDAMSSVGEFLETSGIQIPLQIANNSIISQINSAFQLGATTEEKNYILTKKELFLQSKYYIDNLNVKNGVVQVNGFGAVTLTKPFTLSNPQRIVFDIPNAIVNPSIRNKELYITQTETVKIGQFDKTTARIVISSKYADKYFPVISSDGQNIEFLDCVTDKRPLVSMQKSVFNNLVEEIADTKTVYDKFIFTKPVVYAIHRNSSSMDFYFYNAEKSSTLNLKNSKVFNEPRITSLTGGGIKVSLPLEKGDVVDLHAGNDGKTLRLKIVSQTVNLPVVKKVEEPVVTVPSVVITPVKKDNSKKVVVIDAGHGGSDCGATRNGIYEKNITLDVSKKVYDLLVKKGYDVYMTRNKDEFVSLQDRVTISENISPDIFVSIHVNSSNAEAPNGLETHYYKDNSLQLAKTVHASLLNNIKANNRGLFKSKFYVINHTTAPAILIEIGFISNTAERAQLVSESRKQATAKAIAEGIHEYLK